MQFIEFVVANPVKAAVGVLLLVLFGVVALARMPMQLIPEVETPTITIETRWPGASPQEVERMIVLEQEKQLKSVEGITKMSSECMDSQGRITLEFAVGTEMDGALLRVNSRLQQVREYPEDADEPVITTTNSSDRPIAWFILSVRQPSSEEIAEFQRQHPQHAEALESVRRAHNPGVALVRLRRLAEAEPALRELLPPDIDVTKLRRFAEDVIEARFERVSGVANSNVLGGLEDDMQVIVDPKDLAARQLTLEHVRQALRLANHDTSGGDYWEGKRRYVVRTLGQFRSPEQVEEQLLAVRDGNPVFVRDVAEVKPGFKKPDGVVRRFGSACMAINVQRERGANVVDVMAGLREANQELNEGVLRTQRLQLLHVYDETEYIHSAVDLVNENIFAGGALTMIVLMLFLHRGWKTPLFSVGIALTALGAVYVSPWFFALTLALILTSGLWFARGALIIGIVIAVSLIGPFVFLHMLGRSLNVISLAGLAFAVGMLVDNAIVVLENIYRRYQLGESPGVAAVRGTHEVWGAVVSSTLANLAVFLPIVFVKEEAGQLFMDISLAISAAVGLSLMVAATVVPVAAARLLRKQAEQEAEKPVLAQLLARGVGHEAVGGNGEPITNGESVTNGEPTGSGVNFATHGRGNTPSGPVAKLNPDSFPAASSRSDRFFQWLHRTTMEPLQHVGEAFVRWVVATNAWLLRSWLRGLSFVVALLGACAILLWVLWPKVEYLPAGNRNLAIAIVLPPPGYNLDQLMFLGETIEDGLEPYWNVDPGTPEAAALDAPAIGDYFFVARGRQVFLGIRAQDPTEAGKLVPMIRRIAEKLPGTFTVVKQTSLFEQGLTAGRTVDIEITGPDLNRLVVLGGQVMGMVDAAVPAAQKRPVPSLDLSAPELHFVPKLVRAAEMQMNSTELGYAVNALIDGAYAADYYVGGDKIDLTIIGKNGLNGRPEYSHGHSLRNLPIATPTGDRPVPLDALAEVKLSAGPEQINRRERQRAITVEVTPPPDMPLEDAMQRIRESIVQPLEQGSELEGGYRVTLSGTADKLTKTWDDLYLNLVFAAVITYLLMAALFESWLYPLVIISSVLIGGVGGILGLRLLNVYLVALGDVPQTLDVLTMLGFVILIGTVVNNPILIVHQSLNHMREDGMSPFEAIQESTRTRIRPIMMTTITTVLGLLPLVLFPGAGSELYRGLGSVMLGGLVLSTLLTLFLIPTLFSLAMQAKASLGRMFGSRRTAEGPEVAVRETAVSAIAN
jgi:HAE1 family hydrophobic/amphiphilic exporter-1